MTTITKAVVTPKPKTRKELYLAQYEASKRRGRPFFPDVISHDALVSLIVFALIFTLAIFLPAASEAPADPTGHVYSPRPEWYFFFLFQWLKLFSGALEPVGAVVAPLIAVVALFLLPFFDRGLNRAWSRRRVIVGIGALVVLGLLVLELGGALSTLK